MSRSSATSSFRLRKHAGNFRAAVPTPAVAHVVAQDVVPGAANDGALAARADSVPAFRPDVPFVNKFQPHFKGDGASAVQRVRRRRRLVLELEIRMEGGEVHRDIVAEVLQHPVAELAELAVAVVQRGNDEVGDLEPDVGFVQMRFMGLE